MTLMDAQHSELLDLIPAYALDALSAEEKARVEAFLASSSEGRTELETYRAMLVGFATLTPKRKAPAHLTGAFAARLAAEAGDTTPTRVPSIRPQPTLLSARWILAAAAVLVVLIGAVLVLANVADREGRQIRSILNDPAATRITINSKADPSNKITIVMVPHTSDAVMVAELPSLPAEKQYQLWWMNATTNARWSLSVFSVDQGTKQVLITMPAEPEKDTLCGVTIEPAGGSPGPTGSPVVVGKLLPG